MTVPFAVLALNIIQTALRQLNNFMRFCLNLTPIKHTLQYTWTKHTNAVLFATHVVS